MFAEDAPADERVPRLAPRRVERGDLWQLGRHRLLCGDSGDMAGVDLLLDGKVAAFAFADPPYNAGVAQWDRGFVWRHDWLAERAAIVAVTPGTRQASRFLRQTEMPYRWAVGCWIANGMTRGDIGFANWIPAFVFARGRIYRGKQDFCRVTIQPGQYQQHKGQKPLAFLDWLISLFPKPGSLVIDPFLGSGTTLIACERTGRRCYGMEIEPHYCDIILRRWEQATGGRAVLLERQQEASA